MNIPIPPYRREVSNPVDAPPVPARSHLVNQSPTISHEVAARYRSRRKARRRELAQFVFPFIVLIGAYPVAAFIASLAGNPVP